MTLLLKRQPLVISPVLAQRIGLNEAIILQQICYWLEETSSGVEHGGKQWIYNTIEQWNEQFPFWSHDTVKRSLNSLKKRGLVDVKQLNKSKHDRTNFYAINFDSALLTEECNLPSSIRAKPPSSNRGNLPSSKGAKTAFLHTEITTETTPENLPAAETAPAQSGVLVGEVLPKSEQTEGNSNEPSYDRIREVFWQRFDAAYQDKYNITLPRNAKTNSQVKQLISRLGKEAPAVGAFYVTQVNDQRVVMASHTLDFLVLNAEGYRTQWANGRAMTGTRAKQIDQSQANYNAADEAKAMLRAKRSGGSNAN